VAATWCNWAGNLTARPRQIAQPASEAELIELVRATRAEAGPLRVVGTAHSFVPLCAADGGILVSLDGVQGVIEADRERGEASVWAGTKMHALGAPLLEAGLALTNQGDIDRQSIGGAVGTGTHGTGPTLGNISTQVVGLRLVLASGEVLDCSETQEPEVFEAARVALGALGLISRLTLRCQPAYRLHERTWVAGFDDCLAQLPELIRATRHFEFWWVPHEDACAMKALDVTDAEPAVLAPPVETRGRLARYMTPESVDWSYRVFPSERTVPFVEMEYAVPAEQGPDCLRAIRDLMRARHRTVTWGVEYRTVRADTIPLSPAYGRDTVTISIHQAAELPCHAFFADAEAVFRSYQGRPHWGKWHWLQARHLRDLYPAWDRFQTVRARLDPAGRLLNPYLRRLLLD